MELSPQQKARYDRIRGIFNGPVTVCCLRENPGNALQISLYALPEKFLRANCETDSDELRNILSSGLAPGWKFDATSETFTFRVPALQTPTAPVAAPGISAAELGKALRPADRAAIRWNQDAELQRRYPSVHQYQEAVAMGLA